MNMLGGSALIAAKGYSPDFGGVEPDVLKRWERIQKRFGRDLPIRSGKRTPETNKGVKGSQHLSGKAVDVDVAGMPIEERLRLIRLASDEGMAGIGVYNNTLHFDTGPRRFWGPTYKGASLPGWAKDTIRTHMAGGFARGDMDTSNGPGDFSSPRAGMGAIATVNTERKAALATPAAFGGSPLDGAEMMAKMEAPAADKPAARSPYFDQMMGDTPKADVPADGGSPYFDEMNGAEPARSPYFDQMMNDAEPAREPSPAAPVVAPEVDGTIRPAPIAPVERPGGPGAISPPPMTRDEPNVMTTAPAPLAGMDEPRPRGWVGRQVDAARGWVEGDAEFDVPELGNAMRSGNMGGPPGISWMAPDKTRKDAAKLVEDAIRAKLGPGATDEAVNDAWNRLDQGLFVAENEAAMAKMVADATGAEIIKDKNGNLYAEIGGQRFALDKSGWSAHDFMSEVPRAIGAVAGATIGAGGGRVVGGFVGVPTIGRVAGGGGFAAGEAFADNFVSNMYGGGQTLKPEKLLMAAAFGATGEAVGALIERVGPSVWRAITEARMASRTEAQFRQRLRAAGYDDAAVEDAISGFLREAEPRWDGDALRRIYDARTLPVPIELTAGQATRDMGLWRAEDKLRNVTTGSPENDAANAVSRAQQRSLGQNASAMLEGLGALPTREARGRAVQNRLAEFRAADKARVDAAYVTARNSGRADVDVSAVRAYSENMKRALRRELTPSEFALAREALDELDTQINNSWTIGIKVDYLERWRRKVTRRADSTADGGERYGLRMIRDAYDEASTRFFAGNLIKGDSEAVMAWRRAVNERKKFGKRWESDNILNKLTVLKNDTTSELKLDTSDVMNELLTGKNVGREVRRLRGALGHDSAAFRQIKADMLERIFGDKATREVLESGDTFPVDMVRNLANFRRHNGALYNELFTASERSVIERMARTVKTINIRPRVGGEMNVSGSGYTMEFASSEALRGFARLLTQISGSPAGAIINGFLRNHVDTAIARNAEAAAARSVAGMPPPAAPPRALPGPGAAIGSAYGQSESR